MFILSAICFVALIYLLTEMIKSKWIRRAIQVLLIFAGLTGAFRIGITTGDSIARANDAREVQEVIEIVQNSLTTNSVQEIQAKLEILKKEIPNVIVHDDRLPLLKALNIYP